MMTQIGRRVFTLAMVFSAVLTLTLGLARQSDTGRATVPASTSAAPLTDVALVAAKSEPKRWKAMAYAKAQKGDPYRYGATGPGSWDCSGLVQAAYRHAGISIPRTTGDMLHSRKLVTTTHPHWGDLAFFGTGHVELYTSGVKTHGRTYGAHKSGTRVGYRDYNSYYHPTVFKHVVGAG